MRLGGKVRARGIEVIEELVELPLRSCQSGRHLDEWFA